VRIVRETGLLHTHDASAGGWLHGKLRFEGSSEWLTCAVAGEVLELAQPKSPGRLPTSIRAAVM
jgi:hypothetical protein